MGRSCHFYSFFFAIQRCAAIVATAHASELAALRAELTSASPKALPEQSMGTTAAASTRRVGPDEVAGYGSGHSEDEDEEEEEEEEEEEVR